METLRAEANYAKDRQAHKGRIILTTYRICFVPEDPAIFFQLRLNTNYFDVPLAMVAR